MMKLILNVGLNVGATTTIAADVAEQIVVANGFLIHRKTLVQSDTEPTLVCEVSADPLAPDAKQAKAAFSAIAEDLQQDCIALYSEDIKAGALVGPRAAKWGRFNPEFFFGLDGQRLGVTA